MTEFYVYQLIDSRNNLPFYVGKGKGDRMHVHVIHAQQPKGISSNRYLERKIKSILQDGGTITPIKLHENLSEQEALDLEVATIQSIGINNLCNLTMGGIGGDCLTNHPRYDEICRKMGDARRGKRRSPEVVDKVRKGLEKWRASDEYQDWVTSMKTSRRGAGNPQYGVKEDQEHKEKRMHNMLATPRWNAGKTKVDDPRLAKLGAHHIGKLPPNAVVTKLRNTISGEIVTGNSLKEAARLAGISLPVANRLKKDRSKINQKGWMFHE